MAKNKNKQNQIKSVETREDEIIILNEASEEQMIEIDTSALDEELKGTKGAALVMPIRGGTSDNSKKKEDKKDKSNKDKSGKNDSEDKKPSAQSIFSKFLEGEVKADEVKYESIEDLEDALESQNLIDLGKLVKTHPEILAAYFNAVGKKPSENKDSADKESSDDVKSNPIRIRLSKKQRRLIEDKISAIMDKLNKKGYIKPIFKAIKKELSVDIASIVNRLLDILDNYDDDKFNEFIETITAELDNSEASTLIKYFTEGSAIDLINFLFDTDDTEGVEKYIAIKNRYNEIVTDDVMTQALSEAAGSDDLYKSATRTIIRIIKSRVEEKLKKGESKSNKTTEELKGAKKTELRRVSKISEARNKHNDSDTPAWYDFFAEARSVANGN